MKIQLRFYLRFCLLLISGQRVLEFLKEVLVCGGGSRQVPIGLSALSDELTHIAGTLLRYVMHNKAVFTKHYMDIVEAELGGTVV